MPKKRASQGLPRDFEVLGGLWIVSAPLKRIFEEVDGQAFAFSPCDFTLSDGSSGPQLYLCNVLRTLDALDEHASRLNIRFGEFLNGKFYCFSGGASLVFKDEIIGSSRVFITPFTSSVELLCERLPLAEILDFWSILLQRPSRRTVNIVGL